MNAVLCCMLLGGVVYAGMSGKIENVSQAALAGGSDAIQLVLRLTGGFMLFGGMIHLLEESGYEVFLPQRDGIEAAKLEGKTEEELIRMIFELDAGEVRKADIVFMNLDGRVPDEGACVELGIGWALGKRCYGFKTDTRAVESSLDLNPMISGCMIRIFRNFDGAQLMEEIRQYLAGNEL